MASAACMCRSFVLRIPFEDARSLRNASEYSAMGGSADGYQRRQQSVSIIHDGRRLIWNYNRPLVRQPAKLVHSRSRTRACALREWAEVPFIRPKQRQRTGDSAAADRNVDALFVFNTAGYPERSRRFYSPRIQSSQSESRVWRVSRSLARRG